MRYAISWLAWAAAISAAAYVSAGVYSAFLADFPTAFPYALGLCAAVGLPVALSRYAGSGAAILVGVAGGLAILLVAAKPFAGMSGGGGEAGAASVIMAFLLLFLSLPLLGCLLFFGLPTAALILVLSGEWKAMSQGGSLAALPRPLLRAGILLVLAVFPIGSYALAAEKKEYEAPCKLPASYPLERKADVYLDVDKPDWPELRRVLEKAAAAQGLRVGPGDSAALRRGQPSEYGLCMPGRFAFGVATSIDVGNSLFEPRGDEYVTITPYAAKDERWDKVLGDLLTAVDARWPGIKIATNVDLGPLLRPEKIDLKACRIKVSREEYRRCLGEQSAVRKETVYVHGPTIDWFGLQRAMKEFGASHGMVFSTDKNPPAPLWNGLCASGKVQISSGFAREVPLTKGDQFHTQIVAYVPAADHESATVLDDFVAALEREWPGVVRSRPDPDFCRVLKARR